MALSPNAAALLTILLHDRTSTARPATSPPPRAPELAMDRLTSALLSHTASIAMQAAAPPPAPSRSTAAELEAQMASVLATIQAHHSGMNVRSDQLGSVAHGIQSQLGLMNETLNRIAKQQEQQTPQALPYANAPIFRSGSGHRRGSCSQAPRQARSGASRARAQACERSSIAVVGSKRALIDVEQSAQTVTRKRRVLLSTDPPQTNEVS
ncbi:hypothetical protein V8E36_009258 [Tilletia maclaganii]